LSLYIYLQVKDVQLIKDTRERGRFRGIGYAEFEDRENLIEALQQNGDTLKNRNIQVSLTNDNGVYQKNLFLASQLSLLKNFFLTFVYIFIFLPLNRK